MKRITNPQLRAYLAMSLGLIGMGFSGIFVKWANAPGAVTGFYRMGIATVLLAPVFWNQQRQRMKIPRRETAVALIAGFFFAGDLIFWNTGVLISGATNPTLMGNTAPLWVGLGALLIFREKLNRKFWLGLLLAISGAAVILGLDALKDVGLGTSLGLLSGLFYAGYYLVTQRSRQKLDALSSFWLSALSSTFFLLLAALLLGQPLTGYPTATYWNFLGLALLVQAGGQLAINFALGYLPASVVSPTMLAQPVLTAIFAIPLLGETLSFWQIVGGLAVIAGVYIVHRSRTK
ncbi:MAG: DMT family transporter [Ardenticatenaceae bacterium]|nr:DMT family transporter [Ardenticatenaceae bacterium]